MGRFSFNLLVLSLLIYASGCSHVHTTVAVNVNDMGERIRTKYKYTIGHKMSIPLKELKSMWFVDYHMDDFAKWQPDVFDVNGIPVTLEEGVETSFWQHDKYVEERRVYGWPVTPMLTAMSCFIIPIVATSHFHETWPFHINGEKGNRVSLEACIHADAASDIPISPLRWLLCWWNTSTCYSGKRTFDSHVMNSGENHFIDAEVKPRAMAYGLAVRLKELEDSGQIGNDMAVNTIASFEINAGTSFETPVEIVRCENTTGKDFEYDFVLRRKGGGKLKLFDYERIRSAFRVAIVNTYCMKHPEANPRSLVTDFTRYSMDGECITGRVSVLTIEVMTVFYDAAKRSGRMSAKIGANQFEDVRRFVRKHIEELATRSNIVIDGDVLPAGAIFYTGNERLAENGLLEVEFKTE